MTGWVSLSPLLGALALVGACQHDVVRIGTPDDAASQLAAAALVTELGVRRHALHRETCTSERSCIARLRSGDLDIAVVGRSMVGPGIEVVAPTGMARRPRFVVSSLDDLRDVHAFAARSTTPRIGMKRSFAQRGQGGFARLARAYGLNSAQRVFIDDPDARLAALDDDAVDAVIIDEADIVGSVTRLTDPAGALARDDLVFATSSENGPGSALVVRDAAQTIAARMARLDTDKAVAAVRRGMEPRDALVDKGVSLRLTMGKDRRPILVRGANAIARSDIGRALLTNSFGDLDPIESLRDKTAELALVMAGAEHPDLEAVVVFDSGDGAPATLVQLAEDPVLTPADAEVLLASSALARLPGGGRSIWSRASTVKRKGRVAAVASESLDSLINVLACGFLVWLVVSTFRRRNMPAPEAAEENTDEASDSD